MDEHLASIDQQPAEADADKTVPELDNDELLLRIKKWFGEDAPHCRKWHKEAKDDFDFRAGEQWPDADKTFLTEDQQRVCLSFNRIDPIIDAVIGSEITNRQEVRYLPRQVSDAPVNEVLTEAARWFRDECDAEHEESAAFSDAVTAGMGWTDTRLDYEENPDGEPKIERIDCLEMFWDAAARKANLTDARRIYRVRQKAPLEEVKAKWPIGADGQELLDEDYDATWAAADSDSRDPHDNPKPRYPSENEVDPNGVKAPREVTLVEVQWYELEKFYRGTLSDPATGRIEQTNLNEQEHATATINAIPRGLLYRAVQQYRRRYYKAFLGAVVLEIKKMEAPNGKPAQGFTLIPITGKLDRSEGLFYGLVRAMKDPQRYANKWLTTSVEIMARSAKGGLMIEEGAVADEDEFEDKWGVPGKNSYFKQGALAAGKVQEKTIAQLPAGFMQMTQFAISSIRDCAGVSVEMLGMAEHDQPASLEYQRRQSSTVILAAFFDSLRRYRKIQGRVLLFLITEFLSDARLIRIVGDEGERYVPLTRDPTVTQYDVIVDDAPSSPSQKELVWQSLVQLMPFIQRMQLPPDVLLALLDYSPVPASVVFKIKQAVANAQQNQQPSPQMQKVQIDMATQQQKAQLDQQESANRIAAEQQMNDLEYQQTERMGNLKFAQELVKSRMAMERERTRQMNAAIQMYNGGPMQ